MNSPLLILSLDDFESGRLDFETKEEALAVARWIQREAPAVYDLRVTLHQRTEGDHLVLRWRIHLRNPHLRTKRLSHPERVA